MATDRYALDCDFSATKPFFENRHMSLEYRGVDKYLKLGGLKFLCAKCAANFWPYLLRGATCLCTCICISVEDESEKMAYLSANK